MKKPCIRNLECFRKTGCPRKCWDPETGEGCPAWKELSVSSQTNPLQREIRRQCIDEWMFEFSWSALGLQEGNGQVMETLRNGLVSKSDSGEMVPKMNIVLGQIVGEAARALIEEK